MDTINFMSSVDTEKYELLAQADIMVDNSISFYKTLAKAAPEWEPVITEITNDVIRNKGKLQALRETVTLDIKQLLEDGKQEAQKQLDNDLFVDSDVTDYIDQDCFDQEFGNPEPFNVGSLGGEEDVIKLLNSH
jgi:hypothetical protein